MLSAAKRWFLSRPVFAGGVMAGGLFWRAIRQPASLTGVIMPWIERRGNNLTMPAEGFQFGLLFFVLGQLPHAVRSPVPPLDKQGGIVGRHLGRQASAATLHKFQGE
jgi:hypothetical protein